MVPIPIVWTQYTATVSGQVLKLVPCENCSTEYVYVLERKGEGFGTSFYMLNEGGAENNAKSGAEDTLQQYLENDFDPVPCPTCGHFQRFMFLKLYKGSPAWVILAKLVAIIVMCLSAISSAYWGLAYYQRAGDHSLVRLAGTSTALVVFGLIAFCLGKFERWHTNRFDPNFEDQRLRIEKGRSRALTRAEFEAQQRGRVVRPFGQRPRGVDD